MGEDRIIRLILFNAHPFVYLSGWAFFNPDFIPKGDKVCLKGKWLNLEEIYLEEIYLEEIYLEEIYLEEI